MFHADYFDGRLLNLLTANMSRFGIRLEHQLILLSHAVITYQGQFTNLLWLFVIYHLWLSLQSLQQDAESKLAQVAQLLQRLDDAQCDGQLDDSTWDQEQVQELRTLAEKLPRSLENKEKALEEVRAACVEYEDAVKAVENALRKLDETETRKERVKDPLKQLEEKRVS